MLRLLFLVTYLISQLTDTIGNRLTVNYELHECLIMHMMMHCAQCAVKFCMFLHDDGCLFLYSQVFKYF